MAMAMELADKLLLVLRSYSLPVWATIISGLFVAVSLSLSIYLLLNHLSAYKNPEEQKFLVGVVLMVPIYAIESYISLVNPTIGVDIEILRDGYEAFAMYCFGRYLVACLGGEDRTIEFLKKEGSSGSDAPLLGNASEERHVNHPFPMNYMLNPWPVGEWFYLVVKFGLVQYPFTGDTFSVQNDRTGEPVRASDDAVVSNFKCILFVLTNCYLIYQMGFAAVIHLYVFPAKPYELMGDRYVGDVSVLGDYASVDCPLDPDEVKDSERPTKIRLPQPDDHVRCSTAIKESVRDVVLGGGEYIVNDLKFTVNHAVEPINEKIHQISQNMKKHDKDKTNDDSCIDSSRSLHRVISGIDDPLLNGSLSDNSGPKRARRQQRRRLGAGISGESSDHGLGGYEIRGHRWITKE
uniref:Protein LAZ1 n=1 Tax=Aegilops tauschii TaxID=37682 RepID=M8AWJ9_AEGTA